MPDIFRTLSEHPLAAMTICFVLLLVLYFIGKKLIKLALILLIIAIAIAGYYYFQYPEERPADVKETLEKGKDTIEKGRDMVEKGESALNRWGDAVKAFFDRMKKAAAEIGKIFGGEKDERENKKPAVRP